MNVQVLVLSLRALYLRSVGIRVEPGLKDWEATAKEVMVSNRHLLCDGKGIKDLSKLINVVFDVHVGTLLEDDKLAYG